MSTPAPTVQEPSVANTAPQQHNNMSTPAPPAQEPSEANTAPQQILQQRIAQAFHDVNVQKRFYADNAATAADEVQKIREEIQLARDNLKALRQKGKEALAECTTAMALRATNLRVLDERLGQLTPYIGADQISEDISHLLEPVAAQAAETHRWHVRKYPEAEYDSDFDEPPDAKLDERYRNIFDPENRSTGKGRSKRDDSGSGSGGSGSNDSNSKSSGKDKSNPSKGNGEDTTSLTGTRQSARQNKANKVDDQEQTQSAETQEGPEDNDPMSTDGEEEDGDDNDAETRREKQESVHRKSRIANNDKFWKKIGGAERYLKECSVIIDLGKEEPAGERFAIMRCPVCKGNASPGTTEFCKGVGGLRAHVKKIHPNHASNSKDQATQLREDLIHRFLRKRDIGSMLEGEQPLPVKKFCHGGRDLPETDDAEGPAKKKTKT